MVLRDRLKDEQSREWYHGASIGRGWIRNLLNHPISTRLRGREGKALTHFSRSIPAEDSDLAPTDSHRSLFILIRISDLACGASSWWNPTPIRTLCLNTDESSLGG